MAGLSSLAGKLSSATLDQKTSASLFELTPEGNVSSETHFRFQYFPETIQDNKAVNYAGTTVPGASLPIYQWIAGGERLISFSAFFSSDLIFNRDSLAKAPFDRMKKLGMEHRVVDIRAAVVWLRRYVLPTYKNSNTGEAFVTPPARLGLFVPGLRLGLIGGAPDATAGPSGDIVKVIMTQCDATYESFFSNGVPRTATVQLSFVEIAQYGENVRFPGRTQAMDEFVKGNTTTWGYKLPPLVSVE
jgi:hypothetical protein